MAEMVKALLNEEWLMVLPDHRAKRPEWYTKEGWEKKRLQSMYAQLLHGRVEGYQEVVYYVGAEEGEMAALCQIWGAKMVLFEPNPKVWSTIKAIWEANNLEKPIAMFGAFASDETKKAINPQANMELGEDGFPRCASEEIIAAHGFKELDKEADSYDQITIDEVVFHTFISPPTAISLDVEGSEGKVLRGAERTLRKYKPRIWLSGHPEFLHDNFEGGGGFKYLRELRDWLKKDIGYQEEILDYDHEVHLFYKPL